MNFRKNKNLFIFLGLLLCSFAVPYLAFKNTSYIDEIPAFPGAEGFGSLTPGGRGGRIIEVTNLNPDGPGSFKEACEVSEPRIVVFKTGGIITLQQGININDPFITIAGQSAPGDGICLRGAGIRIRTHDVVIRGMRIRVGDDPNGPNPNNRDGIIITNGDDPPYNIIIDHCSVTWAVDENFSTWRECHDITLQYNIFGEGLRNSIHPNGSHSSGMLLGRNGVNNISIHHNLFAHNGSRNPVVQSNSDLEMINNVIYNWFKIATEIGDDAEVVRLRVNVIGNYYKSGANSIPSPAKPIHVEAGSGTVVYIKDNIGPGRVSNSGDDWLLVDGDETVRATIPAFTQSGVTVRPVEEVVDFVLENAGAVSPGRDNADLRLVDDVRNGTGAIIDSQNEVGGWANLSPGTIPLDNDLDGMPNDWEASRGLNMNDPADGNEDSDGDGYTNVEEYLNQLLPMPSLPTNVVPPPNQSPGVFELSQNYPNPFNPSTNISYTMPKNSHVVLNVYNSKGQEIYTFLDRFQEAGSYTVIWSGIDNRGRQVGSGIYYYVLKMTDRQQVKKMIFLK